MVEATPADRDRVVDFLRAASICAVVVGHWSIAIVWWGHGVLRVAPPAVVQRRVRVFLPHQLGFFYADGTFARASKAVWWSMVAVGLGLLIVLTTAPFWSLFGDARFTWFPGIGYCPKSLLGTDVERVSNAYPPTVCFLLGASGRSAR